MIELYNGDCLEVMDKLIERGVKVDCVITDPPYKTISGVIRKGYLINTKVVLLKRMMVKYLNTTM